MTSSYKFEKREDLDTAVSLWIDNETSATETYGDINSWDVNTITDFSDLFIFKNTFNSDISSWDVSNGTDFSGMFSNASIFDQDISNWDVSSGIDFSWMFGGAKAFSEGVYGDPYSFT